MSEHRIAEQYEANGVARDVLRAAGVDYTGDRATAEGTIVTETAVEAACRLVGHIAVTYPEGIGLLLDAGIKV